MLPLILPFEQDAPQRKIRMARVVGVNTAIELDLQRMNMSDIRNGWQRSLIWNDEKPDAVITAEFSTRRISLSDTI